MNAVVLAVAIMLVLSLLRIHVVVALLVGALTGGFIAGMGITDTITVFTEGLGSNAVIALSYALLGSFAVALSRTGLPVLMVNKAILLVGKEGESRKKSLSKVLILFVILMISSFSQNLIPVHIAIIPIFIPPLLHVLNELQLDRRLVATVITFGLITPYMWFPVGFGGIFHEILQTNMKDSGLTIKLDQIPTAMTIPSFGMIAGLLIAVFITYRKPRSYETKAISASDSEKAAYTKRSIIIAVLAIAATLFVQLKTDSMIFGALSGIVLLYFSGQLKLKSSDAILTEGMKMMSYIGFVMIAAAGFAEVMRETGDVEKLVKDSAALIGNSTSLGVLLMLVIGLLVTMGIGSSFSTIPIITTIFVPLCAELGLSVMATIALIGTSAALGDAGSPASDSTLGPTSGLNVDNQHNHIWDTCVPTFMHYNLPLIVFGYIAVMVL
ncbi:Na+/H+ antiporter family protein [Fictibacillus phosphorivorans]|uniref:Na+/H+ antiporter family protein n=1 Tax=Fictibacillus phosphorivorans TaxID=1221500 RepID=UPI00203C9C73|nr:Na+/H+ antiporter family protein [Fictibacillus phosphorivorans]MCM3718749.1 Na+/H+ antiporter family protein [Fictibacillus phosphorivorans]MCM3776372.1 Na+/H+ antiporter family protein [Fictibacillus phosphorivorans]